MNLARPATEILIGISSPLQSHWQFHRGANTCLAGWGRLFLRNDPLRAGLPLELAWTNCREGRIGCIVLSLNRSDLLPLKSKSCQIL